VVSDAEARFADKARKAVTIMVSAAGTWLLLRVLFRLAQGRQELLDPELCGFVVLAAAAVVWIRAAKRVSRRKSEDA
jgi:hypothetical protein